MLRHIRAAAAAGQVLREVMGHLLVLAMVALVQHQVFLVGLSLMQAAVVLAEEVWLHQVVLVVVVLVVHLHQELLAQ